MAEPLRAAIIGLRNHAGTLAPGSGHGLIKSFKAQPDVTVTAYCEWDAKWRVDQADALAALRSADPEAHFYHSLTDLLDQESFELAVILLPPNEAITAALQLARAGKHLFIEKQVARRAEEVIPLRELAIYHELVIQIGYPWRHHPVARQIKELLDEGVLGGLLDIEARFVTTQVRPGLRDPNQWPYRSESQGGGILHMEGGHWLSLFHYFTNAEVKSVTALCNRVTDQIEAGLEDVATVALEFHNGVHAILHMGYLLSGVGARNDMNFILRGREGAIHWPLTGELTVSSSAPVWQGAPVRTFHLELAERLVYADQWGPTCWGHEFVSDFISAIHNKQRPPVTIDDSYRILQIIDAAYQSSQSGQRVTLPWPTDFRPYHARQVNRLLEEGAIRSPAVQRAFARVPRHRLLEYSYHGTAQGWTRRDHSPQQPRPEDLETLYADEAIVTRVEDRTVSSEVDWLSMIALFSGETPELTDDQDEPQSYLAPSSSTSQPSLVAKMLELLGVTLGMKVLEIGVGTGYNAALLAEIVGDQRAVISVDIQEDVVEQTRRLLATLGYNEIQLLHQDGFAGAPEQAPFDRIIATVGCPDLSPTWVQQLKPDGTLLAPLAFGDWCPIVKVWLDQERLVGKFVSNAGFMPIQGQLQMNQLWPYAHAGRYAFAGFQELPAFAPISPVRLGDFRDFLTLRERRIYNNEQPRVYCLYDPARGAVGIHGQTGVILLKGEQSLVTELQQLYAEWVQARRPRLSDYRLEFVPLSEPAAPLPSGHWAIERKFYRQIFRVAK